MHCSSMVEHFSGFVRELISEQIGGVSMPAEGTVFDYWLEQKTYRFRPWRERRGGKISAREDYVLLPEVN